MELGYVGCTSSAATLNIHFGMLRSEDESSKHGDNTEEVEKKVVYKIQRSEINFGWLVVRCDFQDNWQQILAFAAGSVPAAGAPTYRRWSTMPLDRPAIILLLQCRQMPFKPISVALKAVLEDRGPEPWRRVHERTNRPEMRGKGYTETMHVPNDPSGELGGEFGG